MLGIKYFGSKAADEPSNIDNYDGEAYSGYTLTRNNQLYEWHSHRWEQPGSIDNGRLGSHLSLPATSVAAGCMVCEDMAENNCFLKKEFNICCRTGRLFFS